MDAADTHSGFAVNGRPLNLLNFNFINFISVSSFSDCLLDKDQTNTERD